MEKILRYIAKNNEITISELTEKIRISDRSIEKNIQKLQKENKLKLIGGDKGEVDIEYNLMKKKYFK